MIEEQINKRSVKKKKNQMQLTELLWKKKIEVLIFLFLMQRKETENTGYSEKC